MSLWSDFLAQAPNSPNKEIRLRRAVDYFIKDQHLIELVAAEDEFAKMYFDYVSAGLPSN